MLLMSQLMLWLTDVFVTHLKVIIVEFPCGVVGGVALQ